MSKLPSLLNIKQRHTGHLLRGGITFVDDVLVCLLSKKPSRGPAFLSWNITYKCNSRCVYCNAWKRGLENKKELTTEQCLNIIRQAGRLGVWTVSFTGGEPLLRPDIEILIKEAKRWGMNININTNALLLQERAEMLVKNVDTIVVSIDTHKAELHDSIRRVPGIFKKAEDGIADVRELRKLRKSKKPIITLRSIITKKNFRDLDGFIGYWEGKADSISFQPVHHGVSTSIHNAEDTSILFSDKDKGEFIKEFREVQKKYRWLRNRYYDNFPDFLFNKDSLYSRFRCYAGFFNLKLDPYGNCYTCGHMNFKVGNLADESLKDIWGGKKINEFRKMVKEKRNRCICWTNDSLLNVYMSEIFGGG